MAYLELTEEQLVERLAKLQRLSRIMMEEGKGISGLKYNANTHAKAVDMVFQELLLLVKEGDIV